MDNLIVKFSQNNQFLLLDNIKGINFNLVL